MHGVASRQQPIKAVIIRYLSMLVSLQSFIMSHGLSIIKYHIIVPMVFWK